MEQVYIYLYSDLEQVFETKIKEACTHYNLFELRARLNSHRVIKMYTTLITQEEVKELNQLLKDRHESEVLEKLKDRTLEVPL